MPTTVATPGDITKLQKQIDSLTSVTAVLGTRISALETPVVVSVAPTPVPPPPPAPSGIQVAKVVVSEAGRVRQGVAVAPEHLKQVGTVLAGGIPAQADNVVTDRQGWVRWFLLSAILPAGTHVIEVSSLTETRAPVPQANPGVTISNAGVPVFVAHWRRGPVVTESVWKFALPDDVVAYVHESLWADGKGSSTLIFENGKSIPGQIAARTRTYSVAIGRGTETRNYENVPHVPYTRWVKRLGDLPVFAEVIGLDGGTAWQYLKETGMLQNFAVNPTHPTITIDTLGDAPFAVTDGGSIGYASRTQGAPGSNPDIGPHPAYLLGWLCQYGKGTAAAIRKQTDARQGAPAFFRNAQTGVFHRPDEGVDYCFHPMWGNPVVGKRDPSDTIGANQGWAGSHWGAMFYIPYLLWGELVDLEGQVAQQCLSWIGSSYANCGSQLHRHPLNFNEAYTEAFIGGQERPQLRTQAWATRTTLHLEAILPSDDVRIRSLLGWDKTVTRTLWANVQTDLHKLYVLDNTGEGKRFSVDGAHFIVDDNRSKQWQIGMLLTSLGHGHELGVLSSEGRDFFHWLARTHVGVAALPHEYRDRMLGCDNWYKQNASGVAARTILEMVEACISRGPDVFASQESDWAGYIWAIVSFALEHKLPQAQEARTYLLGRQLGTPGLNHYIEPRG